VYLRRLYNQTQRRLSHAGVLDARQQINIVSTGSPGGGGGSLRSLKVGDDTYRALMDVKIVLEAKLGRPVSFDGVLRHLLEALQTHPDVGVRSAELDEGLEVERVTRGSRR
jgi:hypothetical protein